MEEPGWGLRSATLQSERGVPTEQSRLSVEWEIIYLSFNDFRCQLFSMLGAGLVLIVDCRVVDAARSNSAVLRVALLKSLSSAAALIKLLSAAVCRANVITMHITYCFPL